MIFVVSHMPIYICQNCNAEKDVEKTRTSKMQVQHRRTYVRLSQTERFEKIRSHRRGGWSGVCVFYVCISGLLMISIRWDQMGQNGTKKNLKVPRSTLRYPEIPRSTQKDIKVSKTTSKYPEVHQKYQNVSMSTQKNLRNPLDFPLISPRIFLKFSYISPRFPEDIPKISPTYPQDFSFISPRFHLDFPEISPDIPLEFPSISL